jgi:hypothetical protein
MADLIDSVISNSPVAPLTGEENEGAGARQNIELGKQSRASQIRMAQHRTRRGDVTFQQKFHQGEGSTAQDVSLNADVYVGETHYYFELFPFELKQEDEADAGHYVPLRPNVPLRAGRTYRVRVSLSRNQYTGSLVSASKGYRLNQLAFKLPEEVFVQLDVATQDQNVCDAIGVITPAEGRVSEEHVQDFEFTIQKGYTLEVILELHYWRSKEDKLPYSAATLCLTLEGEELPPPPNMSDVLQLSARVPPPPDTAVLHVSDGGEGSLMLRGWLGMHSEGSLSLEVAAFGWVDPEDCADVESYLQKLTNSFHDYNIDRAANVAAWFDKVVQRFGEKTSVLIVDQAGALIPWEMFKLTDGSYLGAHALIVRWAEAQYTGDAFTGDAKYEGRLSAYVHPLDVERMCKLPEMQRLLPSYNDTSEKLQRDLLSGRKPVGLVYICYGGILEYGDEHNSITRFSRFKPYEKIEQIRFNVVSGKLKPRPIFFVNAPYSGRFLKSGQQWCGLARATLKQVAASYIGTIGPIDPSYAARFAQRLLEEAMSEQGVKPAELLRYMRAQAIELLSNEKLTQDEFERAYRELAYPFMYIHYGHPQDWLKIIGPQKSLEAEGGEEHV